MKRFFHGFYYALCGIIDCLKTERNMRVHFCAAFYVLVFMRFYELTPTQKAVVFLAIGAVISAEAMNTAIEAAIDLISDEHSALARYAKDAAAGAVLVFALAAAAVGAVLFFDIPTIKSIFFQLADKPPAAALLLLSIPVWLWVITRPCGKKR